jgi:hypothetical protein
MNNKLNISENKIDNQMHKRNINVNLNPLSQSPYALTPNYSSSKNSLISESIGLHLNPTLNLINTNPDKRFYNYFLNNEAFCNNRPDSNKILSPSHSEEFKAKFDGDFYLK